ncbi:MAG: hypothetical protein WCJ47_02425 [Methanomicrobiales archaeon]
MIHAIRQHVTVERDGLIQLHVPELKAGTLAEVIILESSEHVGKRAIASFIGKGQGCFATAQDADTFMRNERLSWE